MQTSCHRCISMRSRNPILPYNSSSLSILNHSHLIDIEKDSLITKNSNYQEVPFETLFARKISENYFLHSCCRLVFYHSIFDRKKMQHISDFWYSNKIDANSVFLSPPKFTKFSRLFCWGNEIKSSKYFHLPTFLFMLTNRKVLIVMLNKYNFAFNTFRFFQAVSTIIFSVKRVWKFKFFHIFEKDLAASVLRRLHSSDQSVLTIKCFKISKL